jgi:hypothetical protein
MSVEEFDELLQKDEALRNSLSSAIAVAMDETTGMLPLINVLRLFGHQLQKNGSAEEALELRSLEAECSKFAINELLD